MRKLFGSRAESKSDGAKAEGDAKASGAKGDDGAGALDGRALVVGAASFCLDEGTLAAWEEFMEANEAAFAPAAGGGGDAKDGAPPPLADGEHRCECGGFPPSPDEPLSSGSIEGHKTTVGVSVCWRVVCVCVCVRACVWARARARPLPGVAGFQTRAHAHPRAVRRARRGEERREEVARGGAAKRADERCGGWCGW